MARIHQRVLRNEAEGVTWKVEPAGSTLNIEIVFDDEPDQVITRQRVLAPHERQTGLAALIAEQLADGFVIEPRWTPTADWIRTAPREALWAEVGDAWTIAVYDDPGLFERVPSTVRAYVTLDRLAGHCSRGGLEPFLYENRAQLTKHVIAAAREVGLADVETLFARATRDLDLTALAQTHPEGRLKWGDARAARALEVRVSDPELLDLLFDWIRAHAEDFAAIPVRPD